MVYESYFMGYNVSKVWLAIKIQMNFYYILKGGNINGYEMPDLYTFNDKVKVNIYIMI